MRGPVSARRRNRCRAAQAFSLPSGGSVWRLVCSRHWPVLQQGAFTLTRVSTTRASPPAVPHTLGRRHALTSAHMAHALVHTALCVADAAELGHSALSSGCRPAAPQRRRRPGGRRHACICHGASALASPADAATFPALVWSEDSAPESRLAWGHVGATRLHCEPAGAASRTAARVVAGDAAEAECRTASQSSGASAPHALLDVPPWLASEADGQPVPPPGGGPPGGPTPENEYYLQVRDTLLPFHAHA